MLSDHLHRAQDSLQVLLSFATAFKSSFLCAQSDYEILPNKSSAFFLVAAQHSLFAGINI